MTVVRSLKEERSKHWGALPKAESSWGPLCTYGNLEGNGFLASQGGGKKGDKSVLETQQGANFPRERTRRVNGKWGCSVQSVNGGGGVTGQPAVKELSLIRCRKDRGNQWGGPPLAS